MEKRAKTRAAFTDDGMGRIPQVDPASHDGPRILFTSRIVTTETIAVPVSPDGMGEPTVTPGEVLDTYLMNAIKHDVVVEEVTVGINDQTWRTLVTLAGERQDKAY
jgi:hypothetical protein